MHYYYYIVIYFYNMLFYIMYYVLLQCTNDLIFLYNFTFDIRIRLLVKDDGFTHACHMYKTFYQNTHIIYTCK